MNTNDNSEVKIKFCGATQEVTGSMHLVTIGAYHLLLDAGSFQGTTQSSIQNNNIIGFNPADINYIFISHAHYDHIGRLPLLYQLGFRGTIICTRPTLDLTFRLLDDTVKLGTYEQEDVTQVKRLFERQLKDYPQWESPDKVIKIRFLPAEHILGSSSILFEQPVSLLYTGDLGGRSSGFHSSPQPPAEVDYLIIENTYGNRINTKDYAQLKGQVTHFVQRIKETGGRLLIPVFSIDRAEEILFLLKELHITLPVYLDTPMGIDVLDIYQNYKYLLPKVVDLFKEGVPFDQLFHPEHFKKIPSNRMSQELACSTDPAIILSSSGMLEGGRVLNYLQYFLPNENNVLLFSGYQAEGSLGRLILDGVSTIELDNVSIKVMCHVHRLDGLSAHADQQSLLSYLSQFKYLPYQIFLVHGERSSCEIFADLLRTTFRVRVEIPSLFDEYSLSSAKKTHKNESIETKTLLINQIFQDLNFYSFPDIKIAPFIGAIRQFDSNHIELLDWGQFKQLFIAEGNNWTRSVSVGIEDRSLSEPLQNLANELLAQKEAQYTKNQSILSSLPDINAFSRAVLSFYKSQYCSKGLIKNLADAIMGGKAQYISMIEKKIKNDALIFDEGEIRRRDLPISGEQRKNLSEEFGAILKQSINFDEPTLVECFTLLLEQLK